MLSQRRDPPARRTAAGNVLVHPLTDSFYDDHSRYAVRLGAPVALKLNTMRGSFRTERYPRPR
jgi:aromatic ring-cleaving dioxygenase